MKRLSGKTAIVTGAAGGLGSAICRLFAREGAGVAVADLDLGAARVLAGEITAVGGRAFPVRADVTSAADAAEMTEAAVRFAGDGGVNILVNNAGIAGLGAVTEISEADWNRVLAVNLTGAYLCSRRVIPEMVRAGGGSIVCISSVAGVVAQPGQAAYHASKHGLIGLVRAMALDHARDGIRVNAVCPGAVETPLLSPLTEERMASLAARHALGRIAQPEEIAAAVLHLASDESSFTTGTALLADGGWTAQ